MHALTSPAKTVPPFADPPDDGLAATLLAAAGDAGVDLDGAPAPLLRTYLPALVGAAATGRRLTKDELRACRSLGRQAARDGVALAAAVDLYMSATWKTWPRLPELARHSAVRLPAADAMTMGAAVLRAADDAIGAFSGGYAEAQRTAIREEEARRREFIDDLLGGQSEIAPIVERAERFGLRLAAAHLVAVVRADQPFTDGSRVTAGAESALRARFPGTAPLVATKDGLLLAVLPPSPGADGAEADIGEVLARAVGGAVPGGTGPARWQVGVGRAHAGASGVVRSYREAREALDLAGRLGLDDPVVHAERLLVYRVLLRDHTAMADLVRAVLSPLEQARTGPEPLLETLSTYFASGGMAAEAARRLHLSVRALTYRLARIRSFTGYDVSSPPDRLALEVSVIGARLLDWPRTPLPSGD